MNLGIWSDEAKAQLQAIQFVDQEMARTNLNLAALQTARIAYGRALLRKRLVLKVMMKPN